MTAKRLDWQTSKDKEHSRKRNSGGGKKKKKALRNEPLLFKEPGEVGSG